MATSSTPTDTPQSRSAAIRRDAILDAAILLFAEQGYHPTTTKDIARAAGVSEGTIYHYFTSKGDLLLSILDRMTAAASQHVDLDEVQRGDFRAFLRSFICHPLEALQARNFQLFRIILSEVLVNTELRAMYFARILEPTFTLVEPLLPRWAAERDVPVEEMRLTLRIVSSTLIGLIVERIIGDELLDAHWAELPEKLISLTLHGLEDRKEGKRA